jgi:hypothetical protein
MAEWRCALELDAERRVCGGSPAALAAAIGRGADLKIFTDFYHHEHIRPGDANTEIVQEISEFGVTYLVDGRWAAGVMSLRQPIDPPEGFGPRPSMSFFLYNQDGEQAIARPFLDGVPATGAPGPSPVDTHPEMPKYHQHDAWDGETNAPSQNFVYDFEHFRFFVRDEWRAVTDMADLGAAFNRGADIKVGIDGLCADLGALPHTVFVRIGNGFHYPESGRFCAETHPIIRVQPNTPMRYASHNWDFGWLVVRSDGFVEYLRCDPYTLQFSRRRGEYTVRWYVREQ